ncbi:MAG TPA: [protein-PII] uridylyltransferase [Hellea balneolensis]|uniref:Bifunctional uridylyltransferase/uridylyl-removing enzyme n=1 Tax=Hellea balneolensis TaxID=287478 RepID=A0A7C5QP40_9PROT|nr:[protein-PII] uridylyltransferase [Hellea balneolensis]
MNRRLSIPGRAKRTAKAPDVTPLSKRAGSLKAKLQAAQSDRTQMLSVCQGFVDKYTAALTEKFEAGDIGAIKAAETRARIYDDLLAGLFSVLCQRLNKDGGCALSVCAVGGYGRGELAPFSDLDLLFLYPDHAKPESSKEMVEALLYILWDLKLKIGHAHRAPKDCMAFSKTDDTILTSLLDLRLIAGDAQPAAELLEKLRKLRTRASKQKYIASKLAARDARHEKAGNSRYVIEPNIKEGKGGLRDLHELYWIARFVFGGKDSDNAVPVKPHKVNAYIRHGLLDKHAAQRFGRTAEFLWAVRSHLHLISGRANEVLSFDLQDALARRMGYEGDTFEQRIERFMQDYFNTAREVGALTRIACSRLESQSQLLLPQGLHRFLPSRQKGLKEPGFVLQNGRLSFSSKAYVRKHPESMLRLFLVAGRRNLDIHPEGIAAIQSNLERIDDEFRQNPDNSNLFFQILTDVKTPGATLLAMNEAGVLGAYIPEFGSIVGHTQFNMHHAFTVDDHSLALIRNLHNIEIGKLTDTHPLTSGFTKRWDTRTRILVYMACLLHDTGKGKGDQCIEGAKLAITACARMGMDDADVETVAWLVRNHLLMSETAQRRDVSDPETIETFARIVGSVKRLQMLCALTVVDIRSVGPGIWNDWKGELLRQLYAATRSLLLSGSFDSETGQGDNITNLVADLAPETAELAGTTLNALPPSYWQTHPIEKSKAHARFFAKAAKHNMQHASKTVLDRPRDITELWVLSQDRKNLFADLAGTIAKNGANIAGAHLHTGADGTVFDVFFLQNAQGLAFGRKNPVKLRHLKTACTKAAKTGENTQTYPQTLRSRRAEAIPVHARVSVLAREGHQAIVEVEGRDRPGLLSDLAQILCEHKLWVNSAHIDVAGPKAVDVFYVSYSADDLLDEDRLRKDLLSLMRDEYRKSA